MSLSGVLMRKGAPVTFSWTVAGADDPTTGTTSAPATSTVSGRAMQVDGDPDLYTALGLIETESPTLLFQPSTAGQLPPLGASVTWGGESFTVRNIQRAAMDGTATMARLVVVR